MKRDTTWSKGRRKTGTVIKTSLVRKREIQRRLVMLSSHKSRTSHSPIDEDPPLALYNCSHIGLLLHLQNLYPGSETSPLQPSPNNRLSTASRRYPGMPLPGDQVTRTSTPSQPDPKLGVGKALPIHLETLFYTLAHQANDAETCIRPTTPRHIRVDVGLHRALPLPKT